MLAAQNAELVIRAAEAFHYRERATALEADLADVVGSTTWRMTRPLRRALGRAPKTARLLRRGVKLMWWTATFQLFRRWAEWRNLQRQAQAQAVGAGKGENASRETADAMGRPAPVDPAAFVRRLELAAGVGGARATFTAYGAASVEPGERLSAEQLEDAIQRGLAEAAADDLSAIRIPLNSGDPRSAETLARRSLDRFPELAELRALLSHCLEQQMRFEEAISASVVATDLNPINKEALFSRGLASRALGRPAEARAVFARAALAYPEDVDIRVRLLEATLASRGLEAARSVMAAAPRPAPDSQAARLWRAILVESGEPDEVPAGGAEVVTRIECASNWAARHDIPIVEGGPIEEIPIAQPRIWGAPPPAPPVFVRGLRPYAVELPHATIASASSLILTRDDCILNDVSGDAEHGAFVSWAYDKRVLAQSGRTVVVDKAGYDAVEIEGGVMLSGLASEAFGHWMPEFLSRLPSLERHPAFGELPLIIDDGMPPSHVEYLRLVCDRPVLPLPANTAFRCRRLLYAPPPTFFPVELAVEHAAPVERLSTLSVSALRMLRERVLSRRQLRDVDPMSREGRGRWLLGRRNLRWRRLLNEAEIAASLEPLGFTTVYPEDLTLTQQIALFRDAEAVVAPNGSALLNLIFAAPGLPTVILSQGGTFNWGGFQGPMEALGHQPLWVCSARDDSADKHADYAIEPSSIVQALEFLGVR